LAGGDRAEGVQAIRRLQQDELDAAAALIKDRARSRGLSTVGELHEDEAARLGLMRMTDQERWLVSIAELIKTVAKQQTKGRDA
jgi:hypothetical protein